MGGLPRRRQAGSLSHYAILVAAQQTEDRRRIGLLSPGRNVREDLLDRAQLFRFVIDDEVRLVAEAINVLAQDAGAQGVESANGRLRVESGSLSAGTDVAGWLKQLSHACRHFPRGFVGE